MVKSFSPPEGIFAFATIAAAVCTREAGCFSPPEGIFAFATMLESLQAAEEVPAEPVSVPLRGFLLLLRR